MKKFRAIFNIISFILLLWTIFSGIYLALPQEYKNLIPQFNWLTALVSGGSTGVLGFSILLVDKFAKKYEEQIDDRYIELANKFLELNDKYKNLETEVKENNTIQLENNKLLDKNNKLLMLDLESKLSNPLVEDYIKERMRGEGVGKAKEEKLKE